MGKLIFAKLCYLEKCELIVRFQIGPASIFKPEQPDISSHKKGDCKYLYMFSWYSSTNFFLVRGTPRDIAEKAANTSRIQKY